MFESRPRLAQDITGLLEALRAAGNGRYACVLDAKAVLFEVAPEGEPAWTLRRFLEERREALFALPDAMAGDGPAQDVFEAWEQDDFFLVFVNRRVAVVVACPDAEALRVPAERLLKTLTDRLFRYDPAYRLNPRGGGFFMGRAQLDVVVVARAG